MSRTPGNILLRCLVVFLAILLSFAIADRIPEFFTPRYTASVTMEVRPDASAGSPATSVRHEIMSNEVLGPVILQQDHSGLPHEQALGRLRSATSIREIRNTALLQISVSAETPAKAAALANAIGESFRQLRINKQSEAINRSLIELREALEKQQQKVDTLRAAATQIRADAGIIDLDPDKPRESLSLDDALAELKAKRTSLRATQEKLAALSDDEVLKEILGNTNFGKSLDPTLSEIAANIRSLQAKLAGSKNSADAPKSPETKAVEERIQESEAQLRQLLPVLRKRIEAQLESATATLQGAEDLRPKLQPDAGQIQKYREAKDQYLREKKLLEELKNTYATQQLEISMPLQTARIWELAEPPSQPSHRPAVVFFLVALAGLVIGVAAAFLPRPGVTAGVLLVLLLVAGYPRWSGVLPSRKSSSAPPPGTGFVSMAGDVKAPQRVPYTPGLTIESAIRKAGGFSVYASPKKVTLVRSGTARTINVQSLQRNPLRDIGLEPGDQIIVPTDIY